MKSLMAGMWSNVDGLCNYHSGLSEIIEKGGKATNTSFSPFQCRPLLIPTYPGEPHLPGSKLCFTNESSHAFFILIIDYGQSVSNLK